jgi:hypothetical protein
MSVVPRSDFQDLGMNAERIGREAATTPKQRSINVHVWRATKFPVSDNQLCMMGNKGKCSHEMSSNDNFFCSICLIIDPIALIAPILNTKYNLNLVPDPIFTFQSTIKGTESKPKSIRA